MTIPGAANLVCIVSSQFVPWIAGSRIDSPSEWHDRPSGSSTPRAFSPPSSGIRRCRSMDRTSARPRRSSLMPAIRHGAVRSAPAIPASPKARCDAFSLPSERSRVLTACAGSDSGLVCRLDSSRPWCCAPAKCVGITHFAVGRAAHSGRGVTASAVSATT